MEIIIVVLLVGFLGLVGLILKTSSDDVKKGKVVEDTKARRIADLESQLLQKDGELKKLMEDRQRLEEEFFKAKDDAEIFRRENADLQQKAKQSDKFKEELVVFKDEVKYKDIIAHQETIARQKMEGELSLCESELEKIRKELDDLRNQLNIKNEMFDGLKGQYNELEAEIQKLRMGGVEKSKGQPVPKTETISEAEPPKVEPPQSEPPKVEPPQSEPLKVGQALSKDESVEKKFGIDTTVTKKDPDLQTQKSDEIPGFPKSSQVKLDIKKGVPADVEFFKAETPDPEEEKQKTPPVEEPFKFTNANKPVVPPAPPFEKKETESVSGHEKPIDKPLDSARDKPIDSARDKQKSKRETLIPGFHPKGKEDKPG